MRYCNDIIRALSLCGLISCASPSEDGSLPATPISDPTHPTSAPTINREVNLGVEISPAPDVLRVDRVDVEIEEAEDGLGDMVTAPNPVAVDIVATRWIGRALDPVLEVDDRRFRQYVHPAPGLIRFVLADAEWLDDAQVIAIQYGDDLQSRIPLSIDQPGKP